MKSIGMSSVEVKLDINITQSSTAALVEWYLGAVSILRCRLTSIGIPMLKIRRSPDRLIFNMGILITGKDGHYIETGPCLPNPSSISWSPSWKDGPAPGTEQGDRLIPMVPATQEGKYHDMAKESSTPLLVSEWEWLNWMAFLGQQTPRSMLST